MLPFGPYIEWTGYSFECLICYRFFPTWDAILAHCRNTSQHEWCEPCERVFLNRQAKAQHLAQSPKHAKCRRCPGSPEFRNIDGLEAHLEEVHHWCSQCDIFLESGKALEQHDIKVHNMCAECGELFDSNHDLEQHRRSHKPRTTKCYGCNAMFKSYSSMLNHIEGDKCPSDLDETDIWELCAEFYLNRDFFDLYDDDFPYCCPQCYLEFSLLSSLWQHTSHAKECRQHRKPNGCLGQLKQFLTTHLNRHASTPPKPAPRESAPQTPPPPPPPPTQARFHNSENQQELFLDMMSLSP